MITKGQMKTRRTVAIAALALLSSACGGGSDTAAGDADGEPPVQAAGGSSEADDGASAPSDPDGDCPLTSEEVSAVVGVEVTDFGCAWTSDSGGEDTGPDDLRVDVFYDTYPASLFSTYRQQAEERSDVVTVEGVGDEAYSVADSGLTVLVGELVFSIHVAVHNPETAFDADAAERELAVLIIGRQS